MAMTVVSWSGHRTINMRIIILFSEARLFEKIYMSLRGMKVVARDSAADESLHKVVAVA
jgi:hypothetical protein